MTKKELKQKRYLDKMLGRSQRNQQSFKKQTYRETFERLMRRNKEHLSPTGGNKAFTINERKKDY
jgi:hypothetical protein